MTKVKKMADLKSRILPLFRRSSGSSAKSSSSSIHSIKDSWKARSKSSLVAKAKPPSVGETVPEEALEYYQTLQPQELALASPSLPTTSSIAATHSTHSDEPSPTPQPILPVPQSPKAVQQLAKRPTVTLEEPTPDQEETHPREEVQAISVNAPASIPKQPTEEPNSSKAIETMPANGKQWPLKTLLDVKNSANQQTEPQDYFGQVSALSPKMQHRRIWVKRPGASATMVMINEGDLVDDVRDMILRKYANSLGRTFDSPDVTLRIVAREHSLSKKALGAERVLGPEESMTKTLDVYYPGGQTVDEALIIDVPQRRTPRHSPRVHGTFYAEDIRPTENAADYFPVMPMVNTGGSPHMPSTVSVAGSTASGHHHSIAILNTGQVPTLPSPGGSRSMRHSHRPKFPRNNTASPTIMNAAGSHIGKPQSYH